MEKTYASRLVGKLAALGLLKKSSDPRDERSFTIALTRAGRRTYDRIFRIAFERNASWLAVLSPDQRHSFFECLDILDRASRRLAGPAATSGPSRSARRAGVARIRADARPSQQRPHRQARAAQ
jgi:hypothetical protein